MARIEMNNSITTMITDLSRAAENIPNLRKQLLQAEADVVEPALRSAIVAEGLVDSGNLRDSIGRTFRKQSTELLVGPSGVHHKSLSSSFSVKEFRNGHLGYIFEYGAPLRGIRARRWMSKTVSRVTGQAFDAADAVYYKFMKDHKL